MKVLFIQESGLLESLGIASLSAVLKIKDYKVDLLLLTHTKNLYKEIKDLQPDIVAFSCYTGYHGNVFLIVNKIKQHFPKILTIVGGPHPTFYPEETIAIDGIDIICRGEGEEAIVELVSRLEDGTQIENIPNLWIKLKSKIYKNPMNSLVKDLDSLPLPDRELYYKYKFLKDMTIKRFITGRGCPYPCTFCHTPLLRKEYGNSYFIRRKSVDRVIEEILYIKRLTPLKSIHFSDDTFTLNKNWLEVFAHKYRTRINIPFTCNARLDTPEDIIKLLREAGCGGVQLGLETGDETLRKNVLKKNIPDDIVLQTVWNFRKYKISTLSTNMIALPGETLAMAKKTVEMNSKMKVKFMRCNIFMAYPKLEIVDYAKQKGFLENNFSLSEFSPEPLNPVFKTDFRDEFINLANLFYVAVKFKFLRSLIYKLIKMKPNRFFDFIGSLNLFQEYFFFRMKPISALLYFKNTLKNFVGFKYGAWPTKVVNDD